MDLSISIEGKRGATRALYSQIKAAILAQRVRPGERLPSSRDLAKSLNISRNTIIVVYEQLASEGFVFGRHGGGTFVTDANAAHAIREHARPRHYALSDWARRLPVNPRVIEARPHRLDFRPGTPSPELARAIIARLRRSLRLAADKAPVVAVESDLMGLPSLRALIAAFLRFSRGVKCESDDIIVTSGTQQSLDLVARIFAAPGAVAAIENPGYPVARMTLTANGYRVAPVPVDDEGIVVESIPRQARLVYVTPSHQFPLGLRLSPARRSALSRFARATGALIIEDDYDSEFRFHGMPLESLQGLNNENHVIYLSSFSKILFQGFRLGCIVAPADVRDLVIRARWLMDRQTSVIPQMAAEELFRDGKLGRHLKKARSEYGERHDLLVELLREHAADHLNPISSGSGLHIAALLKRKLDASRVIRAAARIGIGLYGLSPFYVDHEEKGFIFGYGLIGIPGIREAIPKLATILDGVD